MSLESDNVLFPIMAIAMTIVLFFIGFRKSK
jgi:LPXTG-motif cell wall-anchored protein